MNDEKQIVWEKKKKPSGNLMGYYAAIKMITDN